MVEGESSPSNLLLEERAEALHKARPVEKKGHCERIRAGRGGYKKKKKKKLKSVFLYGKKIGRGVFLFKGHLLSSWGAGVCVQKRRPQDGGREGFSKGSPGGWRRLGESLFWSPTWGGCSRKGGQA